MGLWFLAVVPPQNIKKEIILFQKEIEQEFGAVHAQKTPPHITIIPPFEADENQVQKFESALENFIKQNKLFLIEIILDGFQVFDLRTLFVDVAKNEAFEKFCKQLKNLFHQQKIIPQQMDKHFFVPHITLANKDLRKRDFKNAWEKFKNRKYLRSFELSKLHLLKYNGETWSLEKEILILIS